MIARELNGFKAKEITNVSPVEKKTAFECQCAKHDISTNNNCTIFGENVNILMHKNLFVFSIIDFRGKYLSICMCVTSFISSIADFNVQTQGTIKCLVGLNKI